MNEYITKLPVQQPGIIKIIEQNMLKLLSN